MCPNVKGIVAIGGAAHDACPSLIQGLSIKIFLSSLQNKAWLLHYQSAWVEESVKSLQIVTNIPLLINEDDRDEVVFVSPLLCAQHHEIVAGVALEKSERDVVMETARVERQAKREE
jgi:hypothetical protein